MCHDLVQKRKEQRLTFFLKVSGMSPNRFGFELETVSPLNKRLLAAVLNERGIKTVINEDIEPNQRNDYIEGGYLSLVDDMSIKTDLYGVEIRSHAFPLTDLDSFRALFDALAELKVTTNKRCGIHVHVSNRDRSICAKTLLERTQHEKVRVRPERKTYSKWDLLLAAHEPANHYLAVNQRKWNHVEFRWFNASINFRYLCKVVRLVDKYTSELYDLEAAGSFLPSRAG